MTTWLMITKAWENIKHQKERKESPPHTYTRIFLKKSGFGLFNIHFLKMSTILSMFLNSQNTLNDKKSSDTNPRKPSEEI